MSHSITTTASYVLHKYSRSYPSTSPQGNQGPAGESEWQHFTNPVMRIILEAKKSPSGQLVSMRLRILWSIQTDPSDLYIDQREVSFEDLELLSFSSLPAVQTSASLQSDQGLPLKAVYRDAVVGIRYLHPKLVALDSQPTYRRFQITFKDALDASQFIDAIKSVCPCKANPQPAHSNRPSLMRAATTLPGPVPPHPDRLTSSQRIIPTPIDRRPVPPNIPGHLSESQTFSVAPSVETNLSSDDSAFQTCTETSYRTDTEDHQRKDLPKKRGRDSDRSSLPTSSQLSSSDQSVNMPPPPVPRRAMRAADATSRGSSVTVGTGDERSQFVACLGELHPSLYDLSRTELERIVSQVIREEGFLQLLESLDSLWRVKGLLSR